MYLGWEDGLVAEGLTPAEATDFIQEHNDKTATGLGYTNAGPEQRRKDGSTRQVQRCGYFNESCCCPAQREIVLSAEGLIDVRESTAEGKKHVDHKGSKRQKGLPGEVRGLITPSLVDKPPKAVRAELRKRGLEFDSEGVMQKLVEGYVQAAREKKRAVDMPAGLRGR